MAGVARGDPGLPQQLGVSLAFIAQWVEFGRVNIEPREATKANTAATSWR